MLQPAGMARHLIGGHSTIFGVAKEEQPREGVFGGVTHFDCLDRRFIRKPWSTLSRSIIASKLQTLLVKTNGQSSFACQHLAYLKGLEPTYHRKQCCKHLDLLRSCCRMMNPIYLQCRLPNHRRHSQLHILLCYAIMWSCPKHQPVLTLLTCIP